jgi:hypothetical protein
MTMLELPADSPEIDALEPHERAHLSALWQRRAEGELRTSTVFAELYRFLVDDRACSAVLTTAAAAVGDELRHAETAALVAARYGGRAPQLPNVEAIPSPSFGPFAAHGATLFAVLQSCLSESIGAAYLGVCWNQARGAVARTALHTILQDEIEHCRLGWAHLASRSGDASMRRVVSEGLPTLLARVTLEWLKDPSDDYARATPGHGMLNPAETRRVLSEALESVIFPGFEHVGVDARAGRKWATDHLLVASETHANSVGGFF